MVSTVFTNARIIVSFGPFRTEESMLVSEGRISAVGKLSELNIPDDADKVDLHGRYVLPGFIDAHMHLDSLGEYLNEIDLVGVSSIEELQTKVRGSHGIMGWVLGHGWDEHRFSENRMPTKGDLDEIESVRPVYLSRVDLHSAVINTRAIDLLELKDRFHRSENLQTEEGEVTGIIRENVFEYVDRAIKEKCNQDESCTMLLDALNEAARNGITTVGFVSCTTGALRNLERLRKQGLLNIRVRVYISADELDNYRGFENDDMLSVVGVKIFADGSLGTKTALLSFPYVDDPETRGLEVTSQKKMLEIGKKAEELGLHIATHAIGDRALDNVIDVYKQLKGKHRIDHVSLIRKDQMDEMETFSPTLVVQPHFIITDFWTLERIGRNRAELAYPFRSLLDRGFDMALSTDCPVEPLNPWETVYAAVTRGKPDGTPLGQISNGERLTLEEAMNFYTKGSASAVLEERAGSLEVGKFADFTVLEKNPFDEDINDVRNIRIDETYVSGRKVFPA